MDTSALDSFTFERAGARLFAVAAGDGPPVILLHGGLSDHRGVWLYARPIAERFRVIAPDLRGAGRSHDRGPLRWEQLADDVAALVAHLGLGRAVLGGASFGAGVAVAAAVRHPEIVTALVLLTPAFAGGEVGFTPAQRQAMEAMDAVGRRVVEEGVQLLHPLFAALPEPVQARARAMVDSFDPASVAATTRFLAEGGQPFATGHDLEAIDAPVLVVPGTDPTHPREVAEIYRRRLRRCTVRDVEQPGWGQAVVAFLDEHGLGG
ncbi:MAG TPA: alpha/beta hydrolase, partial [Kofleriaceae bacterium]|nr:alpha/beta hydrolase [Kofleriaceae bacterium]